MSTLQFDDAAAERLERMYLGPDVTAQREDTLERLALRPGERVLDIGSGPGFLCRSMAEAVGPDGHVHGIDISPQMVARSEARNGEPNLTYAVGDAVALDEADGSYDVVVSTQVVEYVPDVGRFAAEAHRVLRPGGRALILATDWDTVVWHTGDLDRMARMMRAFEPHCADPRLPRSLAGRLLAAGFAGIRVSAFPMVSTVFEPGRYGHGIAEVIRQFATSRELVGGEEADAWHAELEQLASEGRYFFSSTRFIFEATRPS